VKSGAEGWLPGRSRSLTLMFGPEFGLPFVGSDRLARFGGLLHLWLRSRWDRPISSGHPYRWPPLSRRIAISLDSSRSRYRRRCADPDQSGGSPSSRRPHTASASHNRACVSQQSRRSRTRQKKGGNARGVSKPLRAEWRQKQELTKPRLCRRHTEQPSRRDRARSAGCSCALPINSRRPRYRTRLGRHASWDNGTCLAIPPVGRP
jgi:hypothetical protein